MPLPKKDEREKKVKLVSLRLSKSAAQHLRELAKAHNISQADVVEYLVKQEWELFSKAKEEEQA